jgi:hypothetical protein
MGLLDLFGAGNEGGGILGGIGRSLRDAAPVMSAYGSGEDMGMAQLRSQQMQARRQQQQEEEFQKQAAAALAQKMGLPPELASSPESVFSLARSMKLAEEERKNRVAPRLSTTEQWLDKLRQDDPVKFNQIMEQRIGGGNRKPTLEEEVGERERVAERLGIARDDPRYPGFVGTGQMPRESQQRLTTVDKKELWSSQDENLNIDHTIQALDQAKGLNDKTYTGFGAGVRGNIVSNMGIKDPAAHATREFGQLMSMEAIQMMAQTLKGATTDFELNKFVEILADPSTPPPIRARTIDRMKQLAERKKALNTSRIGEIDPSRAVQGDGRGGAPTAPGAPTDLKKKYGLE